MKKRVAKRSISIMLVIALLISGISYGGMTETRTAQASFGSVMSTVNGIATIASKVGAAVGNVSAMGNASAGKKALAVLDGLLGTNFVTPSTAERLQGISNQVSKVENKVDTLQNSVDQINSSLKVTNNKLDTISSRLDKQDETLAGISDDVTELTNLVNDQNISISGQISSVSGRIEQLINNQTEELKITLFNSTVELQNTMTLLGKLNTYYNSFSGLASVEDTILQDLEAQQKSFESFMASVEGLDDSKEVRAVLEKISLNYEDSYEALSTEEKALLDQTVTVSGSGKVKISKYMKDYLEYMHTYMTTTIYSKGNGYIDNIYDTVKLMGEYITGEVKDVGNIGVGEIFYQSSMIDKSTNAEVHIAYKNFMSNVLQQYYVTAYLCELSLGYQVAYESVHDGNTLDISTKKSYLENVKNQLAKVNAYYGYELNHCIQKYDFSGYKDGEYEQYLCYYGNTVNAKLGISNWCSKKKADVCVEAALSDASLELAVAEEKPLHFYQGLEDWTKSVTWTSEDESIAVVNKDGSVTGVSPGATVIVAEFDSYRLECPVSVMNCYAVKNDTGVSVYHYGENQYKLDSTRSYDYYYGADCYTGKEIVLSEDRISAGLVEATGLSEEDIALYTWNSSNPSVAACRDGQIILTDDGSCVIHGYRYLEDSDVYESIGLPVRVTWDTSSEMESDEELGVQDYTGYTKISSRKDLEALRDNPEGWGADCKYVLTEDIDLGGDEWAPIGYQYATTEDMVYVPFEGVFEGNGHVIKNFKITEIPYQDEIIKTIKARYEYNLKDDSESNDEVKPKIQILSLGLFGYVKGGAVRNLKVTGGNINMEARNSQGEYKTGKTFEVDGKQYTLVMDSQSGIYAGLLVGDSDVTCYEIIQRLFVDTPGNPSLLEYDYDSEKGHVFSLREDADVSKYTKDMPESIKNLGPENGVYLQYIALEAIRQGKFQKTTVSNCYAEGSITVNASQTYAGGLFGSCSAGVERSSADVVIKVVDATGGSSQGALGGLIGRWRPKQNDDLSFCTAKADIDSGSIDVAGGLVGAVEKGGAMNFSGLNATEEMINNTNTWTPDKLSKLGNECLWSIQWFLLLGLMAEYTDTPVYFDFDLSLEDSRNIKIENCQAYGTVKAGGNAGGLIGKKKISNGETKYWIAADESEAGYKASGEAVQPNLDITECYVDVDVSTTGDYAAGIIGYIERQVTNESKKGSIDNCYVHGDIEAGKAAAGVIGARYTGTDEDTDGDDIVITDVVVACESIKANTVEKNTDTEVYPVCAPSEPYMITDTSRIGYYDTINFVYKKGSVESGGSATSTSGQGTTLSVTQLNSTGTYTKLWDPCFCNLNGLDFKNGVLPSVLDERCFFNTEKARKYYHVGDTFEPMTTGVLYTGTGSKTVGEEDGVESTTPDMSKPGVRKVTVSYNGQYAKDYLIYIYPVTESYIKVTGKPTLEQKEEGYTISGGEIGVYLSDGTLSKTVSIDDCTIDYGDGYVGITYEKMNTSLKVLTLEAYANQVVGEDEIEQVGTWYYLSGDTVKADQIVEKIREVTSGGTTQKLELLASSLSKDVTITSDLCVFSIYQKKAEETGSTETPSDNPGSSGTPSNNPGSSETPSNNPGSSGTPSNNPGSTVAPGTSVTPAQEGNDDGFKESEEEDDEEEEETLFEEEEGKITKLQASSSLKLTKNKKKTFIVTVKGTGDFAMPKSVKVNVTNKKIVKCTKITRKGKKYNITFKGLKAGSTKVKVTAGGKSCIIKVTVKA